MRKRERDRIEKKNKELEERIKKSLSRFLLPGVTIDLSMKAERFLTIKKGEEHFGFGAVGDDMTFLDMGDEKENF